MPDLRQAGAETFSATSAPLASSTPFACCAARSPSKSSQRLTISHSAPVSDFGFSYGLPGNEIGVVPTVLFADGSTLTNPSPAQVKQKIGA